MGDRGLDFIVIGAQKAATTSLFHHLREHPEIYMPPEKEAPFFDRDHRWERGFDAYMRDVFADAPAGSLLGKANPTYMAGNLYETEGQTDRPELIIPGRIHEAAPDAKLISLLRDPVERCVSDYRMQVRLGEERRDFGQMVSELLEPAALRLSHGFLTGTSDYIVLGEYGRILAGFAETFPAGQLWVGFTADLESDPQATLADVFRFLGVDDGFVPESLGRRFNPGGTRRRLGWVDPQGWERRLRATRAEGAWRALPEPVRRPVGRAYRRAKFRLYQWNVVPGEPEFDVDAQAARALRRHYEADRRQLEDLIGRPVPWPDARESD